MKQSENVRCELIYQSTDDDAHRFLMRVHNGSGETIHLLQTGRMPYVLQRGDSIEVAFSVQEPNPDEDYFFLEVPLTRPLGAGDTLEEVVALKRPIALHDHFSGRTRPPHPALTGPVRVTGSIGYVPYLLTKKDQVSRPYQVVVSDQHIVTSAPITIPTP